MVPPMAVFLASTMKPLDSERLTQSLSPPMHPMCPSHSRSQLGASYSWMLDHGVVDERSIIMAFLVVEKLRGQASKIAPWIDALPKR